MSRPALFALALLPLTLACGDAPDEDRRDEASSGTVPYCEDVERGMTVDEVTSFGISGADFLERIPADTVGRASFEGMGESALDIRIAVDVDSLRYVESTVTTPDPDGPVALIAVFCPDRIEADAEVSFVSEDGQLAESLDIVLSLNDATDGMDEPGAVTFHTTLDPSDVVGSLELDHFMDVDAYDSTTLYFDGSIVDQVVVGAIDAMGELTGAGGPDAVAMAVLYPVAVFDASPAE